MSELSAAPTILEETTAPDNANQSLPRSVEAEQSVLAAVMLDNSVWDLVCSQVVEDDFYIPAHRDIFICLEHLAREENPFDPVTVSEKLDNLGQLEACGGLPYLIALIESVPSIDNVQAYTDIVLERSMLRRLIQTADHISDTAYNPGGLASVDMLAQAERKILEIADSKSKEGGPQAMRDLLKKAVDRIDLLFSSEGTLTGLTTGFDDLNDMTSGFQPSDMIVLAARPSMGKTTLAMNLVENALLDTKKNIVVFSLEMPAEQLMMRSLSSVGLIDQTKIRTGQLEEEDWLKLSSAVERLKSRSLFIDDTASISPQEMRARLRRIVREHGDLGLIMVDYLQLMTVPGFKEGRTNEISEISRSLKAMAKEFNVPLIALSQLNRSLEQRPNKRPVNSDLRESGAIEQDADVILFIYRDEVYNPETEHKGVAEVIIGKQRNGPIGVVRLAFLGKYTRFENLAPSAYEQI